MLSTNLKLPLGIASQSTRKMKQNIIRAHSQQIAAEFTALDPCKSPIRLAWTFFSVLRLFCDNPEDIEFCFQKFSGYKSVLILSPGNYEQFLEELRRLASLRGNAKLQEIIENYQERVKSE